MRMLKRLLRWLIKTALMLVVLFAIVIISQYLSHRYKPGSVLVLKLDGAVVERSSTNALGIMSSDQSALDVIRRSLKAAGTDNRIVGLAIKVFDPQMQLAQAQELCAMIAEFRSHGKWTTAYMETAGEGGFGNLPFMVASAADEVSMMPQGEINILGVGMREMFARGLLDWIKVNPNFAAIGKYKDAYVLVGGEIGLDSAVGVPEVSGDLSIGWAPRSHDRDHDGIPDDVDECPDLPEDIEGVQDQDGCPENDSDSGTTR